MDGSHFYKNCQMTPSFSFASSFQTSCNCSNRQICKMNPPDPTISVWPRRLFNNGIFSLYPCLLLLFLLLPVNKLHWYELLTLPSPSFDANDYLFFSLSRITLFSPLERTRFPNSGLQGMYWFGFAMPKGFIQVKLGNSQCWNADNRFWPCEREETDRADCSLSCDVSGLMATLYRSLSVPLGRRTGARRRPHACIHFLLWGRAFWKRRGN